MTKEELKKKIAAILSQASGQPIYSYRSGGAHVDNEQLLVLRILYAQCPSELRKDFVPLLLSQVTSENAAHVCHCVLDVGTSPMQLNVVLLNQNTRTPIIQQMLRALSERLETEPYKFSVKHLDVLEHILRHVVGLTYRPAAKRLAEALEHHEVLERIKGDCEQVQRGINAARYVHIKKELLEGANPEINTDKEALVLRMETLGFRHRIATALEEADKKLSAAATSLDYKGVMDLVRTAYEETFEDAANSVANGRKKTIPSGKNHFARFLQFLVNEDILTTEEGELSQKLYNYLSNAGSHALGSAPEQARVSKNVVIEVCLLVLGRIQNLRSTIPVIS
jgi:hypothetical protein